jgi:hypothetical protein
MDLTDPPEVNWGDDAWGDDPRSKRLLAEVERLTQATSNWATGTCPGHTETPHPTCHKCNKEIVRLEDTLDSLTHALVQAVSVAEAAGLKPIIVNPWRKALGWAPLIDRDES